MLESVLLTRFAQHLGTGTQEDSLKHADADCIVLDPICT